MALAEIVFDTPLPKGATHLFEIVVQGNGGTSSGHGNAFRYPVDQYSLQVRFAPDAIPRRVYRFAQSSLQREKRETGDLQLGPNRTVALGRAGAEAGSTGHRLGDRIARKQGPHRETGGALACAGVQCVAHRARPFRVAKRSLRNLFTAHQVPGSRSAAKTSLTASPARNGIMPAERASVALRSRA